MTSKSPTSKSRKTHNRQSGQLLFSDLDTNDSHIVQDTLLNADWSGGALTCTGKSDLFVINWSFNGDLDLDFLAVGESITLTYEITVSHSKPTHRHPHRHQRPAGH